ncbi:hypothetical protein GGR56DRAFT_577629 [Xylariaceae sp. FL0804]|nr:hypothetical protein GGR56DRAFT_577629 [Xylariaceae sp. FL0804]
MLLSETVIGSGKRSTEERVRWLKRRNEILWCCCCHCCCHEARFEEVGRNTLWSLFKRPFRRAIVLVSTGILSATVSEGTGTIINSPGIGAVPKNSGSSSPTLFSQKRSKQQQYSLPHQNLYNSRSTSPVSTTRIRITSILTFIHLQNRPRAINCVPMTACPWPWLRPWLRALDPRP